MITKMERGKQKSSAVQPTLQGKFNLWLGWVPALLVVLIAGLIDLRKPFSGDQALFVTGAKAIANGGVLYRDFWDLKQPGIYWFYQLALHLPCSAEVAVHSAEAIYFLVFAAVIFLVLKSHFDHSATAALAAVLACGAYFVICGSWHLTQVEGLVAFPLFMCACLLLKDDAETPASTVRIFLAGASAAVVIAFKLILGILPVCFLLLLIASEWPRHRSLFRVLMALLAFASGLTLILLPIAAYFQSKGQLHLIYRTFIVIPARISVELPHNKLSVLKSGIIWFALRAGPLLLLAILGIRARPSNRLSQGMILWIVLGFGLIVIQRMGWEYHFLLLLCPTAILAAGGVETLLEPRTAQMNSSAPVRAGQVAAILLLMPYLGMAAVQAIHQVRDPRPKFYADASRDAEPLTTSASPQGPIYVLGDPLIYYLSGRQQAVSINGWSPEWLLQNQWQELARQIAAARPTAVFVDHSDDALLAARGQAFTREMNKEYVPAFATADGQWYTLVKQ